MQCPELSTDFLPLMSKYFFKFIAFEMPVCYVLPSHCTMLFNERFQFYRGDTHKQLAANKLSCTKFPNNIGLYINGPF